jgi:hypothetical protein
MTMFYSTDSGGFLILKFCSQKVKTEKGLPIRKSFLLLWLARLADHWIAPARLHFLPKWPEKRKATLFGWLFYKTAPCYFPRAQAQVL